MAKVTPSLLQFHEGFKGYKIGNDCDESFDNVINGLKALLLGQGNVSADAKAAQGLKGSSAWVDAVTLTCFDKPTTESDPSATGGATKTCRKGKDYPVEELVGFIISYLKDCAEEYLTRKPIRKLNRIDGTEVETTTHYRSAADATATTEDTLAASGNKTAESRRAEVNRVVLGVPANCTEQCKTILRNAAQLAGFQEVHAYSLL